MTPQLQPCSESLDVSDALARATGHLLHLQHPEGYWWGELTADTTLESDFILLQLFLYPPADGVWRPPTAGLIQKAAASILSSPTFEPRTEPMKYTKGGKLPTLIKMAWPYPNEGNG